MLSEAEMVGGQRGSPEGRAEASEAEGGEGQGRSLDRPGGVSESGAGGGRLSEAGIVESQERWPDGRGLLSEVGDGGHGCCWRGD